jgi:hypothetical protein
MSPPARGPTRSVGIDGKANVAAGRRHEGAGNTEKVSEAAA